MTDPWLFTLAVAAILATPGPTNTLLATAGATAGLRSSCCLPVVEAAAYLIAVCLLGWGAAPLIAGAPLAKIALQGAVGLYLAVLAVKMWRQDAVPHTPAAAGPGLVTRRQVFVATLLNPKGMIFAFGILPLQSPDIIAYLAAFAGLIVIAGSGWVCLGAALRHGLPAGRARLVPRAAALALAGFSALMILSPILSPLWAG